MRPQQQNRRMRGRNNRKGPNPLTRSYESNGPDVKIRGSAQQIAEKYAALARDAQSAGDRVMAENYLQHAEHYNRIIMAAQGQMPVSAMRDDLDDDEDDRDDLDQAAAPQHQPQPQHRAPQPAPQPAAFDDGTGPQPVIEGTPAEVALEQEAIARADAAHERGPRANGHAGEGDPQQSRRQRRPRRPRRDQDQGERHAGEAEQPEGEPAVAAQ